MINKKGTLEYIASAFSPDGGSLSLMLSDEEGTRFSLILDRAMGTQTYDRIFYDGDEMLSKEQEEELLPKLKRLLGRDFKESLEREIVEDFVTALESRR